MFSYSSPRVIRGMVGVALTSVAAVTAITTFAVLPSLVGIADAAPRELLDRPPRVESEVIVTTDQDLDRALVCDRLEVAEGAILRVTGDVVITAHAELVIRGTIVAETSPGAVTRDATSLTLRAGERIVVEGTLRVADGRPGLAPGEPGGRGGSILLDAPRVLARDDLQAGRGGDGGAAADGGAGGSIRVTGSLLSLDEHATEPPVARAGDGGRGGDGLPGSLDAGAGGPGGDALILAADRGEHGDDEEAPDGEDGLDGGPCEDGRPGWSGYAAIGGTGGHGGAGDNATVDGDWGGLGGRGGNGGDAASGPGGSGGDGGDCDASCSEGGAGGEGGAAAYAQGGLGGDGGDGGNGMGAGGGGGSGGRGGSGGNADATWGGFGGDGGICCKPEVGVGGDGGAGGTGLPGAAFPGTGGTGGAGGDAGTFDDFGGNGGDGGNAGFSAGADGGDGGNGGDGWVAPGAGGPGNPNVGPSHLPAFIAHGGVGGWPDGIQGDDGDSSNVMLAAPGVDGLPGGPCGEESAPGQENYTFHDGTFENGFGWELDEVAPPDHGAFAVRFEVTGVIDAIHLHLTQLDDTSTHPVDLFLWEDDGGKPGAPIAVFPGRDPGTVARWPMVSSHRFAIDHPIWPGESPVVWVGMWGDWPGEPIDYFLAVDHDGPGGGSPHTKVAAGLEWPEGWQPVTVPFSEAALGIGLEVTPLGACCLATGESSACCEIRSEAVCVAHEGDYLGDGTSCADSPCGVDRPSTFALHTPCFELGVTDRGSVGFLDEVGSEGVGWRFPSGGPNHLRTGGVWVGVHPDSVLHRSYLADPTPTWVVSSCPAGQVTVDADDPLGQRTRALFDAPTGPGAEPSFLHEQRSRVSTRPEACGYAIVELTGERPAVPGEERVVHPGMFLDLDVDGTSEDDHGAVIVEERLAYLTDGSGAHLGVRVLDDGSGEGGPVHLTLVPNEVFVDPVGFVPELEKWLLLTGADPGHVLHEAPAPGNYSLLVAREVIQVGSESPVWETTPHLAVALVVGASLEELRANAQAAQDAYAAGVLDVSAPMPGRPGLALAPNPFRGTALVRLALDRADRVAVDVHDATGRRVRRLFTGTLSAGEHTLRWDGRTDRGEVTPPGVYFVRVDRGRGGVLTEKLVRAR